MGLDRRQIGLIVAAILLAVTLAFASLAPAQGFIDYLRAVGLGVNAVVILLTLRIVPEHFRRWRAASGNLGLLPLHVVAVALVLTLYVLGNMGVLWSLQGQSATWYGIGVAMSGGPLGIFALYLILIFERRMMGGPMPVVPGDSDGIGPQGEQGERGDPGPSGGERGERGRQGAQGARGPSGGDSRRIAGYVVLTLVFFVALFRVESIASQAEALSLNIQNSRERRVADQRQGDLLACARNNYQDARNKLQDQLYLDFASVPPDDIPAQRKLLKAARKQLSFRLRTQPPNTEALLARWRGNPVSHKVEEQREREVAGEQARAEARDRKDRISLPVNCDELPSQRPFKR